MKKVNIARNICVCFFLVMLNVSAAFAGHPLITDDTGTQGKGNFQLELNSEAGFDKEKDSGTTTKERGNEVSTILSYGISDSMDVVLGVPYQWNKSWEDGEKTSDENGISDMSVELKWMFHEKDGLSFAVKPGITIPAGDDEKGLGAGRPTYGLCFIITKEVESWDFHFNFGYTRNENPADDRKDILHTNIASGLQAYDKLKLVANAGIERNADKYSHVDPAFVLGGVIYSITDAFDIDFGLKAGLNKPETDYSFLAGTALRF